MKDLIELLHDGNTLVVENGEVCAFQGRGISDLYHLLRDDAGFLQGAFVADKVVGKGAAALMVLGGVSRLHACLISEPALLLLRTSRIRVSYDKKVPQIQNRTKTDICPVEALCRNAATAGECLPLIEKFMNSTRQ